MRWDGVFVLCGKWGGEWVYAYYAAEGGGLGGLVCEGHLRRGFDAVQFGRRVKLCLSIDSVVLRNYCFFGEGYDFAFTNAYMSRYNYSARNRDSEGTRLC